MTHAQIGGVMLDIYCEILQANDIHGTWEHYDRGDICKAISDEYVEYMEAYIADDINGSHGQLRELTQLACVAIKGIIRLTQQPPVCLPKLRQHGETATTKKGDSNV